MVYLERYLIALSIAVAHDWMDEAVPGYCPDNEADSLELRAEHLRLRCESAAKKIAALSAALRDACDKCRDCQDYNIGPDDPCPTCAPWRRALEGRA